MNPMISDQNLTTANNWIKSRFSKRECICICPTSKDSNKCACGRFLASHYYFEEELEGDHENPNLRWTIGKCTGAYPTEEYGTLAFQGVHGPNKSHFVRLDFTTEPADIYRLLVDVWGFEPPKLIITVHGGTNNFELPHNLAKALRKGLLKAAKTTNAWIITSGIRMGVVRHVVASLTETIADRKQKFTLIGIAPWGALRRGEDLLNSRGATVAYYLQSAGVNSHNSSMPNATGGSVVTGVTGRHSVANGLAQGGVAASDRRGRLVTLCENHSCFLLVDNGTVGRSGCEMFLRR
uniref:TRPM SLOG domain-containing protein n=1 Tax=Romanomermis culicivorax TaxID=13658 RepID=A0A915IEN1_ROMCU